MYERVVRLLRVGVLVWLPFGTLPAQAGERVAVLVANNVGLPGEPPLQHAGTDARRLAAVLQELGHFGADDIVWVVDQTAEAALRALRLAMARSDAKMLFFYYSGHADSSSLHMRGTRLAMATLVEEIAKAHSPLQLVLLDACQSGAISRAKGSQPGPAFDVRINEPSITGQIIITSSAADEQSYESDAQHGALFSTHWITGLRGAADSNGDGQVTLAEAYQYAYSQTLRDTLLSGGGPQHPSFRWVFEARQEPVLTYLHHEAQLTLHASTEGLYVLFNADERDVLAEVALRAGEQVHLSLAAGKYVIKKHDALALHAAQIDLQHGDDRVLFDRHMTPLPLVRLARKGALGNVQWIAGLGQYVAALGPRGILTGVAGAELQQGSLSYGLQATFSTGGETHNGLHTQDTFAGLMAYLQGLATLGPYLTAGAGPGVGVFWWQQHSRGHSPVDSLVGQTGLHVSLHTHVLPRLGLGVQSDLGYLWAQSSDPAPTASWKVGSLTFLPWASYAVQAQLAW